MRQHVFLHTGQRKTLHGLLIDAMTYMPGMLMKFLTKKLFVVFYFPKYMFTAHFIDLLVCSPSQWLLTTANETALVYQSLPVDTL